MRRIAVGMVMAGGLLLTTASGARAQFNLTIGNPYAGGISIGNPAVGMGYGYSGYGMGAYAPGSPYYGGYGTGMGLGYSSYYAAPGVTSYYGSVAPGGVGVGLAPSSYSSYGYSYGAYPAYTTRVYSYSGSRNYGYGRGPRRMVRRLIRRGY